MSESIIQFPVPASTLSVTVNDETANGVKLSQSGDTLTITDGTPPPPSTITSVTASGPATLSEGATAQYSALVTGTGSFNPAVTWSCSDGTISASGLFTAPNTVETVSIKATSVQDPTKFSTIPVSIAQAGNTVQIQASGGDDTAALQAAFNSTASVGKVLEMNTKGGTFHTNPLTVPAGLNLIIDSGVLITDQSAYGTNSVMFNIASANVKITATGAFAQMPLSFAQSQKDQSEYRHCIAIGQAGAASNVTITGLSISQAGGDGVYMRNSTNVTVTGVSAKGCYRNGMSITGQVTNLTLNSCSVSANLRGGFDIEPNTNQDFLTNVVLNNCSSSNGTPGGLSFGIYALDSTTKPVSITVNGYTSTNDGGYGIFFTNGTASSPAGSITVNNPTITSSAYGGIYGRYMSSGPQITFSGVTIINCNEKGTDPHYGMNSACGVDLTGGQKAPCGGANFNIKLISNSTKNMVNYFQQGNQGGNAQKTTFGVAAGGSMSGATNPNAITKYP